MMLWRVLLSLLLLGAGAAGLAALVKTRPQPSPLAIQEKTWPVAVVPVHTERLSPTVTLYARVDSPSRATLSAAMVADVMAVPVLEGQRVEAGALLVQLDDRDAKLAIAQREAELEEIDAEIVREDVSHESDRSALALEQKLLALTRRDVERAQRLATRDVGSASRLDETRQAEARQLLAVDNRQGAIARYPARRKALLARRARAVAVLEQARLDSARTQVKAPFSGPVVSVAVSAGDRVRSGDPLLTLYDDTRLELRAQVPTRHLTPLRRALGAGERIEAAAQLDDAAVRAHLTRLSPAVERGRGGSDALFRIDNTQAPALELGRTLRIVVSLPARDSVVAINAEALYGTNRLYILDRERLKGITVTRVGEYQALGGKRQLLVQSDLLKEGTQLVVTHLPNAVDGLKVRVAPDSGTPSLSGQPRADADLPRTPAMN